MVNGDTIVNGEKIDITTTKDIQEMLHLTGQFPKPLPAPITDKKKLRAMGVKIREKESINT